MENKKFENVIVLYENVITDDTFKLVNKIKGCNAQKGPWTNIRELDPDVKYIRGEEVANTDYVEAITVDQENNLVYWGQGDFIIGTPIKDLLIETDVLLETYEDYVPRIRIGVKNNGIILFCSTENIEVYRSQNGFIHESKWVQDKTRGNNCWKLIPTSEEELLMELPADYRVFEQFM